MQRKKRKAWLKLGRKQVGSEALGTSTLLAKESNMIKLKRKELKGMVWVMKTVKVRLRMTKKKHKIEYLTL